MASSEREFTAATDLCPHPEWWTAKDDESTENEVCDLVYGLVRGLQPDAVLETGTAFGTMASHIAEALEENGHGKLWTIEADRDRALAAISRFSDDARVEVIAESSLFWLPPAGTVLDLCWFDSWYRLRVREFRQFRPFMRKGTIVCFHDTAPGHARIDNRPGGDLVSVIARELRTEIRLINMPTPRGLTLGEVIR